MNREIAMKIKRFKVTSAQIIPLGFFLVILLGAILLLLPMATVSGERTTFLTALFTSTTSVCVTGLIVVDTFSHWTLFGKIIILVLIQLGGLGIIAVISSFMLITKQRMSLQDRLVIMDSYNLDSLRGIFGFLKKVILGTFFVEGVGAIGYMFVLVPKFGFFRGIWVSVFNAVSAFCNAGIDILGSDSLMYYYSNPFLLINTMFLIVMGGLGYVVWFDIASTIRKFLDFSRRTTLKKIVRGLSEHTKLVIVLTFFLIVGGGIMILILEFHNDGTIGKMSFGEKVLNSIFQSVSLRTAGFSSFPQENLREVTTLVCDILMFIGGSPIGTAGGVKTVTLVIVATNVLSFIRSKKETTVFQRRVSGKLIRKATAIISVNLFGIFVFYILLAITENVSMVDGLYEVVSAISTVGLSRGLTSGLGRAGQMLIIVAMYLGRIGPISMALFFQLSSKGENSSKNARGRFFVG